MAGLIAATRDARRSIRGEVRSRFRRLWSLLCDPEGAAAPEVRAPRAVDADVETLFERLRRESPPGLWW